MANPNKRKGTAWESAIVTFLRDQGQDARRVAQTGRLDTGDIHAGKFCVEAKNQRAIDLAGFVDQAEREAVHAGLPYGVAVVKRRGKGAASGYAVMSLATLARLMTVINSCPSACEHPDP